MPPYWVRGDSINFPKWLPKEAWGPVGLEPKGSEEGEDRLRSIVPRGLEDARCDSRATRAFL